jgi:uncharacterized protein (TIGR03083 family)
MTEPDFEALRLDQLRTVGAAGATLTADEWASPSLCASWRLVDVIGHITLGYTTPMEVLGEIIAAHGGDIEEASRVGSIAFADEQGSDALLALLDRVVDEVIREGISLQIPSPGLFFDHVVHIADMVQPLGRSTGTPEAHLAAALALVPEMGGMVGADARAAGLRLHATDLDQHVGSDGPEVAGSAEDILLAVAGRPAGLAGLTGDGVAVLATRTNPPAS